MFGRKQAEEIWSGEDVHMKSLINELCMHRESLINNCRNIIIHKGSAEMLPPGPDKDIELQAVESFQKKILNVIAAYDVAIRQYNDIDISKLVHYNGKASWCNSHEMLNIAWTQAYRGVVGK